MNVTTIEMPKAQAIQAYKEYREAVRRNPNPEDRAVMMGYKALAKGNAIIDLLEAMRAAGLDEQGRPRLAIGHADWQFACLRTASGQVHFQEGISTWRRGRKWRVSLPQNIFAGAVNDHIGQHYQRALTPTIPPKLRPEASLANYHILWEAAWQDVPGDPMLLRHLHGYLYAVLAVWDLTPVEQAVLRGRLLARN